MGGGIFIPYDRLLARGRVVHGTALAVRGTTVSVTGAGDIGADHLVLATGTAYPFPAKHLESSAALARARQIAMYLCRELTDLSLPKIGSRFGGRDHTTVMHSVKKIDTKMGEDRQLFDQVTELTNRIKQS